MSFSLILIIALLFSFVYIVFLLGLMAWMASSAAKTYPPALSDVPAQTGIMETVREFADAYGYKELPEDANVDAAVFRKGRGWLTSLTDLHVSLKPDGSASIEVKEGVNFLFKILYFPINAGTFLGLPIRQRKVKTIQLLLDQLNATPIEFKKGKGVKLKKR